MRPLTVVVDPSLFFSAYGAKVIEALSESVNIWLPRELWHILRNVQLFIQNPDLLTLPEVLESQNSRLFKTEYSTVSAALQQWANFYNSRDLAGLNLYWIGDSLQESLLPVGANKAIFQRSEYLESSFNRYIQSKFSSQGEASTLVSAFRDTTALATSLEPALILSCQPTVGPDSPVLPQLCRFYDRVSISTQEAEPADPVATHERDYFLNLLVQAGAAKLLWTSLELTLVHLIQPNLVLSSRSNTDRSNPVKLLSDAADSEELASSRWDRMVAVWYKL